jgi:hypothetical protein
MTTNCRFALDEKRSVIDTLNPVNSAKGYCHEGAPEDDKYLRERVLQVRLREPLENSDARRNTRRISHPWRFSAMMLNVFCATYMAMSKARQ